ncbi:hypothetical protein SIL81_08590 [Xanthomonas campestris pv. incanae]|uniref:hypothetical protein n=1 Tax=Xanthomonas campestris TaxID=339 RepID=UPI0029C55275|nr:hypothetical protein [Xanthomonas campestris]MDX6083939.1 hypothetical protein [Xanthomonas campestris pv. incanae]MDX6139247.1 hypothetical protein [Xanthomonas campestris pv. incanae]
MDPKLYPQLLTGAFGLIGVIIGGLFQAIVAWRRESKQKEEDLVYLAITVASELNAFASRCADVAADVGYPDSRGFQQSTVSAPALDMRALDVNWKSLPFDLLDRVFALPTAYRQAKELIAFEAGQDPDSGFLQLRLQYGKLGIQASTLAAALRNHVGRPAPAPGAHDLSPQLRESVAKLEEMERRFYAQPNIFPGSDA